MRYLVLMLGRSTYLVGRTGITRHRNPGGERFFALSRASFGSVRG